MLPEGIFDMDTKKKQKIYAIISVIVVVLLIGAATVFGMLKFKEFGDTPEEFRDFLQSFGWWGRLVGLGIQFLQVVIALIPGEVVEIGMGYAFGFVEGTLLCYAGVILASSLVFMLTKKFGVKFVEIFMPREKIDSLRFINTETKLKRLIFILFFIPGTPKDLLTYFIGLTKIKLHEFLIISSLARIPSVISSTIGGSLVGDGDYVKAAIIFAITAAVSLVCVLIYNKVTKKMNSKKIAD